MVRACGVAPILVKFLPVKCGFCGCLFFLPLMFDLSAFVSAVVEYVACWSVAGEGYWIQHM